MTSADVEVLPINPAALFCASWSQFDERSELSTLPQTREGARAVAEQFRELTLLADEPSFAHDRDGVALMNALEDFVSVPSDLAIIYLASHGLTPTSSEPLYRLATGDTQRPNDLIRSIPITDVLWAVQHGQAKFVLLIIDSCYAGRAGEKLMGLGPAETAEPLDIYKDASIAILASSGPYQPSLAPSGERLTAFTAALIRVLTEGVHGGPSLLSVNDLYARLCELQAEDHMPRPWLAALGDSGNRPIIPNRAVSGVETTLALPDDRELSSDNHATILYVENNESEQDAFRKQILAAGHQVVCRTHPDEAKAEMARQYFDIIVIDLFLVGESPAPDLFDYAYKHARESLVLVATRRTLGEEKKNSWDQLLGVFSYPNGVAAIMFKPTFVGQVLDIADSIRAERDAILSQLDGLDTSVPLIAGRIMRRKGLDASRTDGLQASARVCVQRLVSTWLATEQSSNRFIESFQLSPVDSGRSPCSVFIVTPTVRGVSPKSVNRLLLKIGPRRDIEEESTRFSQYVQIGVPLDLRTDKVSSVSIGPLGGIVYSFRGGQTGEIEEVGQLDDDTVSECLGVLFDPEKKQWYASRGAPKRPEAYFDELLSYGPQRFIDAARNLNKGLEKCGAPATIRVRPGFVEEAPMYQEHATTLVHGDLTLANILRVSKGRFALIDYASVGIGPRLVDFARMETEIWLRAEAPASDRFARLEQVLRALAAVNQDKVDDGLEPWLVGPAALAGKCRVLMRGNFPDATMLEYGTILWLTAVRRSELRVAGTPGERRVMEVVPAALALVAQDLVDSASV